MSKRICEMLAERYNLLSDTVNRLNDNMKHFPTENIIIRHDKNCVYYYSAYLGKEKYIAKKDVETIRPLIQKSYVMDVIKESELEMELLSSFINAYSKISPEAVFSNLPDERKKYATPVYIGNINVNEWVSSAYDHKPVINGYTTLKGDKVRSKSELIIADRLWIMGIPYKYECPIMVNGVIIHPDFTILRLSDNRILYYEHCGMMDNPEYADKMVARVIDYNKEGIYLGDRLFMTFETANHPIDVSAIDNLINTHFR